MPPPIALLTREGLRTWLGPPVWGMVHLQPLPGSPLFAGDFDRPLRAALGDAQALVGAGFAGLVVENYGDVPFHRGRVPSITVAAMARVVATLHEWFPDVVLAVNCLRNDAASALAIAAAAGAQAFRVNVHVGAMATDQGVLTGKASSTLRLRAALGADVRILADLRVKHAAPVVERPLAIEAQDLRERGLADAILLTGAATAKAADLGMVAPIRSALPDAPLLVASGVTEDNAARWARLVDGAIIGSALMHAGRAGAGVDPARAKAVLRAWTSVERAAGRSTGRPQETSAGQSRTAAKPGATQSRPRATAARRHSRDRVPASRTRRTRS
jgi:membrane complex biogenesis BtpA family protein